MLQVSRPVGITPQQVDSKATVTLAPVTFVCSLEQLTRYARGSFHVLVPRLYRRVKTYLVGEPVCFERVLRA